MAVMVRHIPFNHSLTFAIWSYWTKAEGWGMSECNEWKGKEGYEQWNQTNWIVKEMSNEGSGMQRIMNSEWNEWRKRGASEEKETKFNWSWLNGMVMGWPPGCIDFTSVARYFIPAFAVHSRCLSLIL